MDKPIIRVELEGVRQQVMDMLTDHDDAVNKMIEEELERQINKESVRLHIQKSVSKAIDSAIESVATDWSLQMAIKEVVINVLTEKINGKNE